MEVRRPKKTAGDVFVFGKSGCPHTRAACRAFQRIGRRVVFRDVLMDPGDLEAMLRHSGGQRRIPVVVDGDRESVGFLGRT